MESIAASSIGGAAPRPERPHVVLVASPGAGHLIPMAELARRLVAYHSLAATLVTFADVFSAGSDAQPAVISSLRDANVSTATLPAVPLDDLPADARIHTVFSELVRRSLPHLRALLRDIGSTAPLAALVPDFIASKVLPLAAELHVPGYLFFPTNLSLLSVVRSAVELNDGAGGAAGTYRELPDPLHLPSGVSVRRGDLLEGLRDIKKPAYAFLVDEGRRYRAAAAGLLVNDFYEMDPATAEEFKKAAEQGKFPPVYPVGPFVRPSSFDDEGGASPPCIQWLDCQPTGSVVYVSFGSAGALSVEQTAELAAGLENSGHRFLWVVRMPSLDGEHSDWGLKPRGDKNDPLAWLPEGFLERTRGRGLAVASWAPQVTVLSHPATAGFVSPLRLELDDGERVVRRPDGRVAAARGAGDQRRGPVGEVGRGAAATLLRGRTGRPGQGRGRGEGADGGGEWPRFAALDGRPTAGSGVGVGSRGIIMEDAGGGRWQVEGGGRPQP